MSFLGFARFLLAPTRATLRPRRKNATLNNARKPETAFPLRSPSWGSVEACTWRNPISCSSFFEVMAFHRGGLKLRPCNRKSAAVFFSSRLRQLKGQRGKGEKSKAVPAPLQRDAVSFGSDSENKTAMYLNTFAKSSTKDPRRGSND